RQQIDVVLVDAKKYSRLAIEYGVHTIPTVMVYKRGIRMLKETGVGSRERLQEMLQMAIQSA
ncbi:MAG: thioredoxin family protein, partial [Magnetococcales bacterium]|nr:thioredoxin family protein [Magnetococcales bacterium]